MLASPYLNIKGMVQFPPVISYLLLFDCFTELEAIANLIAVGLLMLYCVSWPSYATTSRML